MVGGIFIVVGIIQHFALKGQTPKPSQPPETKPPEPSPPVPIAYIKVEGCVVENCSFQEPNRFLPGNTHQIAEVDFLNDAQSTNRGIVRLLHAKITYYDPSGKAYLSVEKGLWKDGSCLAYLGIGDSSRLILAIVDAEGNALAVDHKAEENPYAEHYEEAYSPFQTTLHNGPGRVSVRLSYTHEPEHWFGAIPVPQGQAFWFKLTVGKPLQLERVPE
jgi:hypothetical protein